VYSTSGPSLTLGSALPRQVTPPAWLRSIAGAVLRGTQVTVPTAAGPQTFDLNSPQGAAQLRAIAAQAVAAIRNAASGATISVTRRPAGSAGDTMAQVNKAVSENVPGGWLTIAGAAVSVFLIAKNLGGRR
jgi:hypothetical protein